MLCRSRAELPRSGRDGCVETELPWKSSSSSGSAVTAPTVRRGGRLRTGVPVGERCCGDADPGLAALAWGWRLRRALQPEVGSVFVRALVNHLGSGTRGRTPAGLVCNGTVKG